MRYNDFEKKLKRKNALMDFIVPLLEDLGMAFVKISTDFIDHLD